MLNAKNHPHDTHIFVWKPSKDLSFHYFQFFLSFYITFTCWILCETNWKMKHVKYYKDAIISYCLCLSSTETCWLTSLSSLRSVITMEYTFDMNVDARWPRRPHTGKKTYSRRQPNFNTVWPVRHEQIY